MSDEPGNGPSEPAVDDEPAKPRRPREVARERMWRRIANEALLQALSDVPGPIGPGWEHQVSHVLRIHGVTIRFSISVGMDP